MEHDDLDVYSLDMESDDTDADELDAGSEGFLREWKKAGDGSDREKVDDDWS